MGTRADLVLEVAPAIGNYYGCSTWSSGAWASVGAAFFPNASPTRGGFFWQPLLNARYFATRTIERASSSPVGPSFFGCSDEAGDDLELHLGVDVGYQHRIGPVILVPVFGVRAGYRWNCAGNREAFFPGTRD